MTGQGEDWRAKATANLRAAGITRGRLGTKKNRSGCITCKLRRVRCDEGTPECERCAKSGRSCEGYATTVSRVADQDASALRRPISTGLVLSAAEACSMEYFSHWAAIRIGGWLDAGFWRDSIMQLCHTESFALNAALSISDLYRHSTTGEAQNQGCYYQGLRLYNKAIQATRLKIETGGLHPALAVTSCALFVCIEFLRDDITAARSLIVQGIQLVRSIAMDEDHQAHVSFFRDLLIRLNVLAATFGDPSAANIELEVNSAIPTAFDSVAEARSTLFAIMAESHPFLKEAVAWRNAALGSESACDGLEDFETCGREALHAWQTTLLQSFENW